ncbi:hypothetical protein D9Q98_008549 [Chlorella vulgaris]|uniref:S1 motif domain-containing protein n=1 Tax=Chlorella vulgaris TaxID=3077 RepID=A0A9D4TI91_CHLVU|nr:hypothetical protein D9Q98_008549 [Chlorella vulgaris]
MRLSASQTLVAVASTSGRPPASSRVIRPAAATTGACCARSSTAAWHAAPQPAPQASVFAAQRMRLPPLRVTNEGREMRDPEALKDTVLAEDGFLTMDPENPTLEQEPGVPLERVVGMPYEEALFLDDIEPEAQQYWFTEPADGWKTKKVRMRKLEEATVGMESLANSFGHTGAALEGRLSMDELREGQLLTGTVVAQMLSHGIRVDVGCAYDALLPMEEDGWEEMPADVAELVAIGGEVEVRVHRLRNPRYFRFPIQLAAVNSTLAAAAIPPAEHKPPMDLRILQCHPSELAELSEGLRVWEPQDRMLQLSDTYGEEQGWDVRGDEEEEDERPVDLELQAAEMDAAVLRIAQLSARRRR